MQKTRPAAGVLLLALVACSGSGPERDSTAAPATAVSPATGPRNAVGGISWAVPPEWEQLAPRPMRIATYQVRGGEGEAELAVFFFGPGQGGDVEANIDRWVGQFRGVDGGAPDEVRRGARDVSGLAVTTLEARGTYLESQGPMMEGGTPRDGYAMLAAIVEGPEAPVFFKLTGPEPVVDAARRGFESVIVSLRRDDGS